MKRLIVLILSLLLTTMLVRATWASGIGGREQGSLHSEAVIAAVKVGDYPHGVAVNEKTNRVYVANFSDSTLSVIDGATNELAATIDVGNAPRNVAVNSRTDCIYVANLLAHGVSRTNIRILNWVTLKLYRAEFVATVLDARMDEIRGSVKVGTNPWSVAVNETTDRVYVLNHGGSSVSVIDGTSNSVVDTIGTGLFRAPEGIAVNEETNRVYVTADLEMGPIGVGTGRLLIIDGNTYAVLNKLRVGRDAHVAVNERTNRIYVTSRYSDSLTVIDGTTNEVISTVDVGPGPCGLDVNEVINRIYVANQDGDSLSVVDGDTDELLYSIEVGKSPMFVAVSDATGRVYVTNAGDNSVSVIAPLSRSALELKWQLGEEEE